MSLSLRQSKWESEIYENLIELSRGISSSIFSFYTRTYSSLKKTLTVNSILYSTGNFFLCWHNLMKNFNSVGASGIVWDNGLFSSAKKRKSYKCESLIHFDHSVASTDIHPFFIVKLKSTSERESGLRWRNIIFLYHIQAFSYNVWISINISCVSVCAG